MSFEDFRDSSEGCSGLVWINSQNSWYCGGSLGLVYQYQEEEKSFKSIEIGSDSVTSLAVTSSDESVALAIGERVVLRALSSIADPLNEILVCRRTLSITDLKFTGSNDFL